jgi:Xaa-Pro aminopeptidase
MKHLRERMAETGTDLVVVGPSSHMVWLAGLSPHGDERPVMLMVSHDFAGLLMPALNAESSRQHTDLPFFPWSDGDGPDSALFKLLKAVGATGPGLKIALDETMRADFALLVLDALPDARRSFLSDTEWCKA